MLKIVICCDVVTFLCEKLCLLIIKLPCIQDVNDARGSTWLFSEMTTLAGVEKRHFSGRRDECG